MINTIMFDLDGTILPMDYHAFVRTYFKLLAVKFTDKHPNGEIVEYIRKATNDMITSNEPLTNETVFWNSFNRFIDSEDEYIKIFNDFYDNEFQLLKNHTWKNDFMIDSVNMLKEKGYKLMLVTNPLFPMKAILHRLSWSGVSEDTFSYITSFEKNHYCKPNIKFYEEVLLDNRLDTENCLMVGNDCFEDLVIRELNVKTFLIDDCMINLNDVEYESDYQGSYKEFYEFVRRLPNIS